MIPSLSSEVWGPPISGICGPPSSRFEGFPSLESGVLLPSCAPYLWIRQWPQPFCLYSPLKEFWNPVYPFLGKRLKILIICLNHFKRFIFLHILYCPPSSNIYCIKILELQILAYPVHVMEMTKPVFALTSVSEIRPLLVEDVSVPRRRQWQPTPLLLPRESHGWRNLVGCGPWGLKESDTTERLHFHFSLSRTGEGNGNPLQCSCLENPRDGGAWWTAVYGVAQSRTRLKRLSSSSSISYQVDHLSSEPASWHGPGRGLSRRQVAGGHRGGWKDELMPGFLVQINCSHQSLSEALHASFSGPPQQQCFLELSLFWCPRDGGGSEGKESACNAGDLGLIPGSGRSPGRGNGNPLLYSCLENPMDGGAWRAITVHGIAESDTTESLTLSEMVTLQSDSGWVTDSKVFLFPSSSFIEI